MSDWAVEDGFVRGTVKDQKKVPAAEKAPNVKATNRSQFFQLLELQVEQDLNIVRRLEGLLVNV